MIRQLVSFRYLLSLSIAIAAWQTIVILGVVPIKILSLHHIRRQCFYPNDRVR
jgi:hypothetical protein